MTNTTHSAGKEIELKPCPFCGGKAEFERTGNSRRSCIVVCSNCGCALESNESDWSSGMQWNDRASLPSQGAEKEGEEWERNDKIAIVYKRLMAIPADEYRDFANKGEAPLSLIYYILSLDREIEQKERLYLYNKAALLEQLAQLKEQRRKDVEDAFEAGGQAMSDEYGFVSEEEFEAAKAAYLSKFRGAETQQTKKP